MIKITIPARQAAPKPPIGAILGSKGINVATFCKRFNQMTDHIEVGAPIPTEIYKNDRGELDIVIRSPTVVYLIKKYTNISKGSGTGKIVGRISNDALEMIYKIKKNDFNTARKSGAFKIIRGVARSMGIR
ncbi:uL11 family ribosomal protein [Candidatus Vidania fulgoroideorum]